MTRKVRWTLLTVLFITGAAHSPLLAQSPQATISGIITDSTGAVVPGVQVTAINPATTQRATAVTNGQGFFVLTQLAIGDYTIEAEKAGFKKFVRQGLTLTTGATVALDIQLEI
ncbi:MAG TPA: carboxypeptidase-like regulatory domain-containing protein, partial [Blastocatellia bacterium]|nr:carboxypeptidase-like regulatory domain-containing protein [Blastocatellia bacterium]